MTSLIDRPTATTQRSSIINHASVNPVAVITADPGRYSVIEVAQAYFALGERPIPLCDPNHASVTPQHGFVA